MALTQNTKQFDLIIVGGGLAGFSLALALRETKLRIALLEASKPHAEDPRLFALNLSSCHFLANVGLWQRIQSQASAIHAVHISYQKLFGAVRFSKEDIQENYLGYVVPASLLQNAIEQLFEQADNVPNVTVFRPARLTQLTTQAENVEITFAANDKQYVLQTKLVIGADGAHSTLRKLLTIPTETYDYQQSAIVTKTVLTRSHLQTAYERFYTKGAIAMLPLVANSLGEHVCATIWTADNQTVNELMQASDEDFRQKLQIEFGYRLGKLQKTFARAQFPLQGVWAQQDSLKQIYLIGNAAHNLPPIAAQGLNLALYEAAVIAQTMQEALSQQQPFDAEIIKNIQRNKALTKYQQRSIQISHLLAVVFKQDSKLLKFSLPWGFMSLNLINPLKRNLINRMVGKSNTVPRLLVRSP